MAKSKELRQVVLQYMSTLGGGWEEESLLHEIPTKWEMHGNCALFSPKYFLNDQWLQHPKLLQEVSKVLKVKTLARKQGPIVHNDHFRRPVVELLYGSDPVVSKKENDVQYQWDITKVMFSSGNITEKQRISQWDLREHVVVDLFAGIGYFTLNYLIHAQAKLVYACEWNPEALKWLRNNLRLNKVDKRCIVLEGDNLVTCPKDVADHVNLGLIPSSEGSWGVACAALKRKTGGVLHVHGNVDLVENEKKSKCWKLWGENVASTISEHFQALYPDESWIVNGLGVFKIKSYGPRVDHVVADVLCSPFPCPLSFSR